MLRKKAILIGILLSGFCSGLFAGNTIQLTFDSAIDIAVNNSYRVKRLQLNIKRRQHWLRAEQSGLKSKVFMNLSTPDLNHLSDYKWNSVLNRDVIVRQNTQRWQAELSIRQPIILFGYPTNGYISLNYKIYRYLQKTAGNTDLSYYNRLYIHLEQPLFLPNRLKNDLERAELELEGSTLDYIRNVVEIIGDIGDDYYEIFGLAFKDIIHTRQLRNLEEIDTIARDLAQQDTLKKLDVVQIALELTRVKENYLENRSNLRRRFADIKQKLRLNFDDSLFVIPTIKIAPIEVDMNQAIQMGQSLSPYLRRLKIDKKRAELNVENQKGRNSFRINLEMTYGLERQNDQFDTIWDKYDNSNSVTLNAYIPIWDWGQRQERIQAEQLNVKRNELNIEETRESIRKQIANTFTNLKEYLERSLNLKKSLEVAADLTRISIQQYRKGEISLQDLLQIVNRQKETELKFLDVYLGYKRALLNLMVSTYYDYEKNVSLLEKLNLDEG